MATSRQIDRFVSAGKARLARVIGVWIRFEEERSPDDATLILRELHTLKGEAALYNLEGLVEHVHELESAVTIATTEGTWSDEVSEEILESIDSLLQELDELENAPWEGDEGEPVRPSAQGTGSEPRSGTSESARTAQTTKRLPTSTSTIASISADAIGTTTKTSARVPTNERIKTLPPAAEEAGVFIDAKLVDHIRDVVGDLMLTNTRLARSLASLAPSNERNPHFSSLRDELQRVSSLVGALEDVAREVRMLKTSSLFERFPRMVRDLAKDLDRRVRLRVEGGAINVDRDVLEALGQPLVHLVRNAIDHGIEQPAERLRLGKPETGQLSLEAELKGSTIEMRVSDDGRGLDPDAISRRAVELGLASEEQLATLSLGEKLNMIFIPGMTTRESASEVSGRGVGLDVVRENLAAVGGTVAVATSPGHGTTFTLKAPVSFALSSVMKFRVGESFYAVNAATIHGVVDGSQYEIITDAGGSKLRYAGDLVPLISLARALSEPIEHRSNRYLVCSAGGGLVALADTSDHELREAVLLPVEALQRRRHPVSAGFMLEDGSVALVISLGELENRVAVAGSSAPIQRQRVLVVDDSQLIRELVAEVFREHGFEVLEADNGANALEILKREAGIQLLVTDIEMPQMNGFELLEAIAKLPGFANLPKIVVSTRSSEIDHKMAMERGANDYIVKADFSSQALWSRVEKLMHQ